VTIWVARFGRPISMETTRDTKLAYYVLATRN